jgi:hypothetical protein
VARSTGPYLFLRTHQPPNTDLMAAMAIPTAGRPGLHRSNHLGVSAPRNLFNLFLVATLAIGPRQKGGMRKAFGSRMTIHAGHTAMKSLREQALVDEQVRRIFSLRHSGVRDYNHGLPLFLRNRCDMLLTMTVQTTLIRSAIRRLTGNRLWHANQEKRGNSSDLKHPSRPSP